MLNNCSSYNSNNFKELSSIKDDKKVCSILNVCIICKRRLKKRCNTIIYLILFCVVFILNFIYIYIYIYYIYLKN